MLKGWTLGQILEPTGEELWIDLNEVGERNSQVVARVLIRLQLDFDFALLVLLILLVLLLFSCAFSCAFAFAFDITFDFSCACALQVVARVLIRLLVLVCRATASLLRPALISIHNIAF